MKNADPRGAARRADRLFANRRRSRRSRPAPTEAVATVGGAPITLAEVDDKALEQPASNFGSVKLSQALYEARRAALDEIVANKLIDEAAKAQGVDRAALIEKEITAKVRRSPTTEIASWYQANQGRLQGAPLDQVHAADSGVSDPGADAGRSRAAISTR